MNFDKAYKLVEEQLGDEKSGHSMEHINSVIRNAKKILKTESNINEEIVLLTCLVHDCDDYKIVGLEAASEMKNTKNILSKLNVSLEDEMHVINICKNMGYSNCLNNIRPKTKEGMIVSDADMLDAVGSNGILRTITFALNRGNQIFDECFFPNINISQDEYKIKNSGRNKDTSVNHFFEKLLLIKDYLMTDTGKEIGVKRHKVMYDLLDSLFEENDLPEWTALLKNYK